MTSGRHVLVVEDDPVIRQVLPESLEGEGYLVREAQNGRQALDLLDGWRPDVIVLDLMMPVMDGWAFRAEQRARGLGAHVPVVVLSASRHAHASAEQLGAAALEGELPGAGEETIRRRSRIVGTAGGAGHGEKGRGEGEASWREGS